MPRLSRWITESQLWQSIFRHGPPDTPRTRSLVVFSNFFLHLHPVSLPRRALRYTFTWGLGGAAFLLFLILVATGILLTFYYVPDVDRAYESMKDLRFAVPFGVFLRNVHRWSAQAMVLVVMLHMVRVFYTGSYRPPREFNWVVGVGLLGLTLRVEFHGLLAPLGPVGLLGGHRGHQHGKLDSVDRPYRSLPRVDRCPHRQRHPLRIAGRHDRRPECAAAVLRAALHGDSRGLRHPAGRPFLENSQGRRDIPSRKRRTRRGPARFRASAPAETIPGPETSVGPRYRLLAYVKGKTYSGKRDLAEDEAQVWPHLVLREFLAALTVIILIWIISIVVNAPLEEKANPAVTPNPAKAPWYFVGLQELLAYFDPWIAGVMIPGIAVLGLAAIPYLDVNRAGIGEYVFRKRKFAVSVFTFGFLFWFALIFIGLFMRGPSWAWYWPSEDWTIPKETVAATWNLPVLWGSLLLAGYLALGLAMPAVLFPAFRKALGPTRYVVTMILLLLMIGIPAKIVLRLAFDIKYVLTTLWFNI